jgi:hypothetical protein
MWHVSSMQHQAEYLFASKQDIVHLLLVLLVQALSGKWFAAQGTLVQLLRVATVWQGSTAAWYTAALKEANSSYGTSLTTLLDSVLSSSPPSSVSQQPGPASQANGGPKRANSAAASLGRASSGAAESSKGIDPPAACSLVATHTGSLAVALMQLGLGSLPQLQQLAAIAKGVEGGSQQQQGEGSSVGVCDAQAMTASLIQRHLPQILARLLLDDAVKSNVGAACVASWGDNHNHSWCTHRDTSSHTCGSRLCPIISKINCQTQALVVGNCMLQMLEVVSHFFDSGQVDYMFSSELPTVAVHIIMHAAYPAHGKSVTGVVSKVVLSWVVWSASCCA